MSRVSSTLSRYRTRLRNRRNRLGGSRPRRHQPAAAVGAPRQSGGRRHRRELRAEEIQRSGDHRRSRRRAPGRAARQRRADPFQDNAYYKAYASASLTLGRNEGSTREIAQRMAKAPPSDVPNTQLPNVTYAGGGIAIRAAGGKIIGGLGVSGAPGGQSRRGMRPGRARQDQGSAEVGLGSIVRLSPQRRGTMMPISPFPAKPAALDQRRPARAFGRHELAVNASGLMASVRRPSRRIRACTSGFAITAAISRLSLSTDLLRQLRRPGDRKPCRRDEVGIAELLERRQVGIVGIRSADVVTATPVSVPARMNDETTTA